MTELEEQVYRKIIETMDVDESALTGFTETSAIFGEAEPGEVSMGLDSIDSLELLVMIEKEWGLGEIPGEDMINLDTVKSIAGYIESHLPKETKS